MAKMKVIIADPCILIRTGLKTFLKHDKKIEVVGEAEDGRQLWDLVKKNQPDIVIMEIELPLVDGNVALRRIKNEFPKIKVIIVSQYFHDEYVSLFMGRGANAFLPKRGCSDEVLIDAIRTIQVKDYYFNDSTVLALLKECVKRHGPSDYFLKTTLSERQIEVIKFLVEGKSPMEIAKQIHLSIAAIRAQIQNIRTKTGIDKMGPLTLFALRTGIINLYGQQVIDTGSSKTNLAELVEEKASKEAEKFR